MRKQAFFLVVIVLTLLEGCGEVRRSREKKHFVHKGNVAFREKMYRDAIRYYREAIKIDTNYMQAYNNLCVVYEQTGELDKALKACNKCLTIDSTFTDGRFNRAHVFIGLKRYYDALDDLKQIENSYENKADFYFLTGLALFGLKDYKNAGISFENALNLNPENTEIILNLASVNYYIKNYEKAMELAEEALERDNSNPNAWNIKGMVNFKNGKLQDAVQAYDKGLSLKSNHAYILNNRGAVYLAMEMPERAKKDIDESIMIDPENPWAYRNKGIYYLKKGDPDNALRMFMQCAEMDNLIEYNAFYLGETYLMLGNKEKACEAFRISWKMGEKEGETAYRHNCR